MRRYVRCWVVRQSKPGDLEIPRFGTWGSINFQHASRRVKLELSVMEPIALRQFGRRARLAMARVSKGAVSQVDNILINVNQT